MIGKILSVIMVGAIFMSCQSVESGSVETLNADTKLVDVINRPEFAEFGHLLISQGVSNLNSNDRIRDLGKFYIWHSHIKNDTTIDIINTMIDKIRTGEKIFYDIYSDAEKLADPSKNNTGLFYFRGEPNAPFAVINAGGGFAYVGLLHESLPHALYLSRKGYNAFALQYRIGGGQVACEDLIAALRFIFRNAEDLKVDAKNYSLWGGSAGARMAAYIGSYSFESNLPKPSAIIMQYTGHNDYTKNDPPTFACVGENDGIANWRTMKRRIDALNALGIETEFHKYPNLGHGFGLGIGTTAEGWIDDAINFWQNNSK